MAKIKHLNQVNRVTWNLKVIPNNSQEIINKMKNNLKVEEITALISLVENEVDAYVLTPSENLYQFKFDLTTDDFDQDWWVFALRNYYVVFANSVDKEFFVELLNLEMKDVTGKIIQKGKSNNELSQLPLEEILDLICEH